MNLAVRLVSGGGFGVACATGAGLADALGPGLDWVKLLSAFLHPATRSGNTDRNTNKQRRIQICPTLYHAWKNCEVQKIFDGAQARVHALQKAQIVLENFQPFILEEIRASPLLHLEIAEEVHELDDPAFDPAENVAQETGGSTCRKR